MNIPLLAGIVLVLFGVYMLRHAVASYKNALASQAWPTTDGQLTDVYLWGKRNIGGEMKDADKLVVKYSYQFDGLQYTGTSPTFYTLVYPKTVELYQRYSSEKDVKVYFNPEQPSESVLVPGPNPDKRYSDLILGALAVAMGIVIAILGWLGVIG